MTRQLHDSLIGGISPDQMTNLRDCAGRRLRLMSRLPRLSEHDTRTRRYWLFQNERLCRSYVKRITRLIADEVP